jgi:hypothetical protein
MAKSQAQLHTSPVTDPLVRVRVTRRGHGRISTGERDGINGDLLYEAGEEFEIARSVALRLVGEDKANPNNSLDWVEVLGPVKKDPLDHDGDGVKGGFNHGDEPIKRGPGRPPKAD